MTDPSDWVWLGVVVLWFVLRALPRLFRTKAQREASAAPDPKPTPAQPGYEGAESERIDSVGPEPIEPR